MDAFFGNLFGAAQGQHNFNFGNQSQQNQQQQSGYQNSPPASQRALNNLNLVKITVDDLQEEGNKECLICLDEQKLGNVACKLPCGHIYHQLCLRTWLQKHAQCPVCRYELESDDPVYEQQRKEKMKKRKLRLRRNELDRKTVPQLLELCSALSVSTNDCFDKREIVEKLIASKKIEITESVPMIDMTREELYGKSIRDLRHLLLSFDISCNGVLEKADMCNKLLESNRVNLIESSCQEKASGDGGLNYSNIGSFNSKISSPSCIENNQEIRIRNDKLLKMTLSQLKSLAEELSVSLHGCIDKQDIIDRFRACPYIRVVSSDSELENLEEKLETKESDQSCASSYCNDTFSNINKKKYGENSMNCENKQFEEDTVATARAKKSPAFFFGGGSVDASASDHVTDAYAQRDSDCQSDALQESSISSSEPGVATTSYSSEITEDVDPMINLSIKELKSLAEAFGVNITGCLEKCEMVKILRKSGMA